MNYIHSYDWGTQTYENLNLPGVRPVWMSDNRHLLYEKDGRLQIVDTQTKKAHEILSADPYTITSVCPTKDFHTIYYGLEKTESDLWLLSRE